MVAPLGNPGTPGGNALKTLVLFDSRHGFTEHCLDLLVAEGNEITRWALSQGTPPWDEFDAIVFGGPVYYGRWSPSLTKFLGRHAPRLAQCPRLAAFVVSLSPRAAALRYFSLGLPPVLKGKLGHVACFGGTIQWKALPWWERALVKVARGIETDVSNFDLTAVQGLGAWLSRQAVEANGPQT